MTPFNSPKKRVMVVDDHSMFVEMMCSWLEETGYDPVSAASGTQAIQQMQRFPSDLILMDIHLPDQNGWVLLEKFKKRWAGVPIIILTGQGQDAESSKKAVDLGAAGYVTKGAHLQEILNLIAEKLKG